MQTSCRSSHTTRKRRDARCKAVFSDDWDWPFNPKKNRSRRRRFANRGERISGFTAVFCDDWKDEEVEDEAPLCALELAGSQSPRSGQWYGGYENEGDGNGFKDFDNFAELFSELPLSKWQCTEQSSLPRAEATLPTTPNVCQLCQSRETKPEAWWPPSAMTLPSLGPSPTASADNWASSQGSATQCYSTPETPTLSYSMPIDVASLTNTESYHFQASEEDESPLLSSVLADSTTKGRDNITPSTQDTPEHQWFLADGWAMEATGFDYWDYFLDCTIGAGDCHEIQGCEEFNGLEKTSLEA